MRRPLSFAILALSGAVVAAAFAQNAPSVAVPPVPVVHAPLDPSFPVERLVLSNGLRVVLAPDPALPEVSVHLDYRVGMRDDPTGKSGLAHVVEHMMYEQSRHVAKRSFLRWLSDSGASTFNGITHTDSTVYFEAVPTERLELVLWLESDRMGYFLDTADEAALAGVKSVVTTEERTRLDRPIGMLPFVINDATFPAWHPYHMPIDEVEEVENITLSDVRSFYWTWYGPENCTLIIAGRFDRDSAFSLVRKYFESFPRRPPPVRPRIPAIQHTTTTYVQLAAPVLREELALSWITPAVYAPGDAELDWVSHILTDGEESRLRKRLVETGLAVSVSALQDSKELLSTFTVKAVAAGEIPAETIRSAIDEEIAKLAAWGPTDRELQRAREYWLSHDLFALEDATARGGILGLAVDDPRAVTTVDWVNRRRASVTAAGIRAVAARYLSPKTLEAQVVVRRRPGTPLAGTILSREEL